MAITIPDRPSRADSALELKIRWLLQRHDPHVCVRYPRSGARRERYTWNGATRTLVTAGGTYESCLHDVAHWLVATPAQRACPEFGLGQDPYRLSDAKRVVPHHESNRLEILTCDVQMALVLALGLDTVAVTRETNTALPTPAGLRQLRKKFPNAMPAELWDAAKNRLAAAKFHAAQSDLRLTIEGLEMQLRHIDERIVQEQQWRSTTVELIEGHRAALQALLKKQPKQPAQPRA